MSDRSAEEMTRVRDWLRTESAAKTVEEVYALVQEEMAAMYAAIRAIPEAVVNKPPDGEEWSPLRALQHAVQANMQVAEDVLNVCLTGARPGTREPQLPLDRELLIGKQEEANASLWEHVSFAQPDAFLDVTWPHMFFGELNWREWFLFLHIHAWDHRHQIAALGEKLSA
jgi:hypothetical protein